MWANRKPEKATMIVIGLASRPDIQEHAQNSGKHRAQMRAAWIALHESTAQGTKQIVVNSTSDWNDDPREVWREP